MIPLSTITLVESVSDVTGKRRETQYEVNSAFTDDPSRVLGSWAELRAPKTRAQLIVRWDRVGPVLDGVCEAIRATAIAEPARAADTAASTASANRTGTHSPAEPSEIELAALSVHTAAKALLIAQERGACEVEREAALAAYRAFTKRWGSLRAALRLPRRGQPAGALVSTPLAERPEMLFLESLENDRGRPSELLTGTLIATQRSVPATLAEALADYLDRTGCVDLDGISATVGLSRADAEHALLADGLCYRVPPGCVSYLSEDAALAPAACYLSGDVRSKLATATATRPRYAANAEALRAVLPHRVDLSDIGAGLGSDWIPQRVTEDWLYSLYPGESWGIGLERVSGSTLLSVTNPRLAEQDALRTDRVTGIEILEGALNCRLPVVEDAPAREGGKPRRNYGATAEAQIRAQEVRQRFESWVASGAVGKSGQTSQARREELESAYASRFSRFAPSQDTGQHLTFPGLASSIGNRRYSLRPGQLRGVVQILSGGTYDRSALLAYPPGYGKTDPAICASVKLRQWGRATRTVVAVPASAAGQWVARWRALFPGTADEVLSWTCPRFGVAAGGLAGFLRRAASGAWPYVVLTHEALGTLPPRTETLAAVAERELSDLRHAIREAEHDMSRAAQAVARAELRGRSAELGRLLAAVEDRRRAEFPSWDDLGCDHLVVDEVQNFKALPVTTRMEGVAGLPTRESSRAVGLYLKCQALLRTDRGRVTALSGTPLTNTLAEAYVWMRFLQPRLLREVGLLHFDSWASVFCEPYAAVEMDCVGRFRSRTRLRFRNVPELLSLLGECWSFARED